MDRIPVSELLSVEASIMKLKLIYGKKLIRNRYITSYRIQKPGLGLAGYTQHIHEGRVQILGNTEISYLWTLPPAKREESFLNLVQKEICCFIITKNLRVPRELLRIVKAKQIPLFRTEMVSSKAIEIITDFLEDRLASEAYVHGVMLDVYGIGVLVLGRSGIGKSECAVELIKRGHRLVADDIVTIRKKHDYLVGTSNDMLRHHIEVRGLGILNIKDMFGVTAIRLRKKVELVIEFVDWDSVGACDRLGLEKKYYDILETKMPLIVLPITAGRNMAVIVEVAARNQLLKLMGYDSAKAFNERLHNKIGSETKRNSAANGDELLLNSINRKGEE
jgi:HPr kinase/phosphorylase